MKASYIILIWAVSFIGILLSVAFSLICIFIFLIPFVLTSVHISRHSERLLHELKLDEDLDDEFF